MLKTSRFAHSSFRRFAQSPNRMNGRAQDKLFCSFVHSSIRPLAQSNEREGSRQAVLRRAIGESISQHAVQPSAIARVSPVALVHTCRPPPLAPSRASSRPLPFWSLPQSRRARLPWDTGEACPPQCSWPTDSTESATHSETVVQGQ